MTEPRHHRLEHVVLATPELVTLVRSEPDGTQRPQVVLDYLHDVYLADVPRAEHEALLRALMISLVLDMAQLLDLSPAASDTFSEYVLARAGFLATTDEDPEPSLHTREP